MVAENEAISVAAMRTFLERYNLRQLVILSDACRKAPTTRDTNALTSNPGLRRGRMSDRRLHTDMLRATSSYTAAFMLRGKTEADDRCLFSTLIFEALSGGIDAAFMKRDGTHSLFSDSLATWLETAVPAQAKRYGLILVPEIDPGLRFPDDIYVDAPPAVKPILPPWPDPADIASVQLDTSQDSAPRVPPPTGRSWSTSVAHAAPERTELGFALEHRGHFNNLGYMSSRRRGQNPTSFENLIQSDRANADRRQMEATKVETEVRQGFLAQERPTHFETRAGFAVSGARAVRALLGPDALAEDTRDRVWWRIGPAFPGSPFWVRNQLAVPLPLLVELENGNWTGAAAMPGFIPTFGVDASGARSLVCRQMEELDAKPSEDAVAYHAAGTLAERQISDLIQKMRERKHQDPVLGVLASYLHDRMGDIDNIRRTAYYFAAAGQPIPFDIALLARLPACRRKEGWVEVEIPAVEEALVRPGRAALPDYMCARTPQTIGIVAGAFPWLREGWALLDPEGQQDLYPADLARIAVEILPAPFTTLTPSGGTQLARLLADRS